jgi:hypothetical protein
MYTCDEFLWRIFVTNICDEFLWQIFVTNFCDEFVWRFWFFGRFFLTYNLLTIASFRIGVPSILFLYRAVYSNKLWILMDSEFDRVATVSCYQGDLYLSQISHRYLYLNKLSQNVQARPEMHILNAIYILRSFTMWWNCFQRRILISNLMHFHNIFFQFS